MKFSAMRNQIMISIILIGQSTCVYPMEGPQTTPLETSIPDASLTSLGLTVEPEQPVENPPVEQADIKQTMATQEDRSTDEHQCLMKLQRLLDSYSSISHRYKINIMFAVYSLILAGFVIDEMVEGHQKIPAAVFIANTITTLQGFTYQAVRSALKKLVAKHSVAGPDQADELPRISFCDRIKNNCVAFCTSLGKFGRRNFGYMVSTLSFINTSVGIYVLAAQAEQDAAGKTLAIANAVANFANAGINIVLYMKEKTREKIIQEQLRQRHRRGTGESIEMDTITRTKFGLPKTHATRERSDAIEQTV